MLFASAAKDAAAVCHCQPGTQSILYFGKLNLVLRASEICFV